MASTAAGGMAAGDSASSLLRKSGKIEPMLISALHENPWQPRTSIDPQSLEDLKKSIQDFGFIGYIPVRRSEPGDPQSPMEIVYGHRRVMAARLLGHQTVPVMLCEVSDEGMMRLAYVENATHKRMTYWEEALHFGEMRDQLNLSLRQLADMLGTSRNYVYNRLSLLSLPEGSPLRTAAERNDISMSNAQVFSNISRALSPDELEALIADVRAGTLTHDDLQGLQRALDKAMEIDGELDDKGRRVHTATLIEQARAKELRPKLVKPDGAQPIRVDRRPAEMTVINLDPELPTVVSSGSAHAPTPPAEPAAAPQRVRIRREPAQTPTKEQEKQGNVAAAVAVAEPVAPTQRDGGYYAREAIEQMRGILTHLGDRLEKSDLALLSDAERAEFRTLRSRIIEALNGI